MWKVSRKYKYIIKLEKYKTHREDSFENPTHDTCPRFITSSYLVEYDNFNNETNLAHYMSTFLYESSQNRKVDKFI